MSCPEPLFPILHDSGFAIPETEVIVDIHPKPEVRVDQILLGEGIELGRGM